MYFNEYTKFYWFRSPEQDLNSNERAFRPYIFDSAYFSHDNTENKQTAVHVAAANGHEQCLRVLLENTEVQSQN